MHEFKAILSHFSGFFCLGLLGDATEDMVDKLSNGEGKDIDEEEVYKMAATLEQCNGMEAILTRLVHATSFTVPGMGISLEHKAQSVCF